MGSSTTFFDNYHKLYGCDNPSKWGLQQLAKKVMAKQIGCDNPSKWGLQQQGDRDALYTQEL